MKNLIIFFIFVFFWNNISAEENTLYSAYEKYVIATKKANTFLPLLRFHSEKQYLSFEQYLTHEDLKQGIDTLFSRLKFPDYLNKQILRKEIVKQNTGCLMVSGLSIEQKNISIYVGYIKSHRWLIDSINIEYLNKDESFLETPICDAEALMKKRMENWK